MSNAVRNTVCNAVTRGVRTPVRGCVQNQSQIQSLYYRKSLVSVVAVASIHTAVDARMDGRSAAEFGGGR